MGYIIFIPIKPLVDPSCPVNGILENTSPISIKMFHQTVITGDHAEELSIYFQCPTI